MDSVRLCVYASINVCESEGEKHRYRGNIQTIDVCTGHQGIVLPLRGRESFSSSSNRLYGSIMYWTEDEGVSYRGLSVNN